MSGDMALKVDLQVTLVEQIITREMMDHYPFFGSIRFNFQEGKLVNANIERTVRP